MFRFAHAHRNKIWKKVEKKIKEGHTITLPEGYMIVLVSYHSHTSFCSKENKFSYKNREKGKS